MRRSDTFDGNIISKGELWIPYISTKLVTVCSMDEFTFLIFYKRQSLTARDEIRKTRPGYKVTYLDGFEFWMFKELFEGAYRKITDAEIHYLKEILCEDQTL